MAFPDERDRNLIRHAEQVETAGHRPVRLAGGVQSAAPGRGPAARSPRATSSRCCSCAAWPAISTPRPRCRWPPPSTGPRRWARACSWARCSGRTARTIAPWAATSSYGPPAYYKDLSFDNDLNPQCGSHEATALVTRFTTKDRIAASVSPDYPVMVRALTRAEWLRVLARGFHAECKTPAISPGSRASWRSCSSELGRELSRPGQVDRQWRMDLLDAFSYMRSVDRRGFPAKEAILSGLMSPLPAVRGRLHRRGRRAVLGQLAVADATCSCASTTSWSGITLGAARSGDLHALGRRAVPAGQPAGEGPRAAARRSVSPASIGATSTSRERERLVRPGVPARAAAAATRSWRPSRPACWNWSMPGAPPPPQRRLAQGDRADGLPRHSRHAGRCAGGVEQGKRTSADTLEEQMEIVKRGKVAYLFERYTDELQIQTLLLLLARRQPRSQGADEVPHRQVGPGPLRREDLAAQGPRRSAGPVHRHDRHRRGVPQPRELRRQDALREPARASWSTPWAA